MITDEVYRADGTDRDRLEVIARFRGLDLSASMRVVEVLVVRRSGRRDSKATPITCGPGPRCRRSQPREPSD